MSSPDYEDVCYILAIELIKRMDDDSIKKLAIEHMDEHDANVIVVNLLLKCTMSAPQDIIARLDKFGCVEPEHRAIVEAYIAGISTASPEGEVVH
jgi:hypothetical protein